MLQPHQLRVVNEKAELDPKLDALYNFFGTQLFKTLNVEEQNRLRRQAYHMTQYSSILGERIQAFGA